jgi:antitoxin MazE
MRVIVKKWGNSAAVRIPAAVMAAAELGLDAMVDVREKNGCIVIQPVQKDGLTAMIAGITPENVHNEVNFGAPVGRETH